MKQVAAIILAAGASSRLGEPKQLALLAGETLLARALRTASHAGCSPVIVVLGAHATLIQQHCPLPSAIVIVNEGWAEGMASSIRAGVASLTSDVDAAILMTCDQPAVTSGHLRQLAARETDQITASAYGGRRGVPAYFPSRYLPSLMRLTGDQGAREMLATAPSLALASGDLDIDTPEGLATARSIYQ